MALLRHYISFLAELSIASAVEAGVIIKYPLEPTCLHPTHEVTSRLGLVRDRWWSLDSLHLQVVVKLLEPDHHYGDVVHSLLFGCES